MTSYQQILVSSFVRHLRRWPEWPLPYPVLGTDRRSLVTPSKHDQQDSGKLKPELRVLNHLNRRFYLPLYRIQTREGRFFSQHMAQTSSALKNSAKPLHEETETVSALHRGELLAAQR